MAHPNEEFARTGAEALSKGDMQTFLEQQADDVIVHFPGRGPLAGDYRGKDQLAQLFQKQMEMLDGPPQIEIHDILANDDHVVVLNRVWGTRGGQTLDQNQVVVIHPKNGKAGEVWLHFSDQQAMDEMASS
jgi:ketosteroid isomerase-like protein